MPYAMDVLYQFWPHFLLQNLNTHMYNEIRHFVFDDSALSTDLARSFESDQASMRAIRVLQSPSKKKSPDVMLRLLGQLTDVFRQLLV